MNIYYFYMHRCCGKELLEKMEKHVSVSLIEAIQLAYAAHILEFEPASEFAAFKIAKEFLVRQVLIQRENYLTQLGISVDFARKIAWYFWLLAEKSLPGVRAEQPFGFSITDYLIYNPDAIYKVFSDPYMVKIQQVFESNKSVENICADIKKLRSPVKTRKILDLSHMHLTSLEGLREIPGVQEVSNLILRDNKLKGLHPDIFEGLEFNEIDLSNNCLTDVDKERIRRSSLKALIKFSDSDKRWPDFQRPYFHVTHPDMDWLIG